MPVFSYTTSNPITQSYVVPVGVTEVEVEAVGGTGGNGYRGAYGGRGGRVRARLAVTPGEALWVVVGHAGYQGTPGSNSIGSHTGYSNVNQAAGGDQFGRGRESGGYGAGSGGGASGVRRGTAATGISVVMAVQAGGGGGAGAATGANGGDGGAPGLSGSGSGAGAGGSVAPSNGGPFGMTPPWPGWGGDTVLSWPPGGGTNFGTGAGGGGDGFNGGLAGTVGQYGGSGGGGGSNWIEPTAISVLTNDTAPGRGAGQVTITPVTTPTDVPLTVRFYNHDEAMAAFAGVLDMYGQSLDINDFWHNFGSSQNGNQHGAVYTALSALTPVTHYDVGDKWFMWATGSSPVDVPTDLKITAEWDDTFVKPHDGNLGLPMTSPFLLRHDGLYSPADLTLPAGNFNFIAYGNATRNNLLALDDAIANFTVTSSDYGIDTRYRFTGTGSVAVGAPPGPTVTNNTATGSFVDGVGSTTPVSTVLVGERWYFRVEQDWTPDSDIQITYLLSLLSDRLGAIDQLWVAAVDGGELVDVMGFGLVPASMYEYDAVKTAVTQDGVAWVSGLAASPGDETLTFEIAFDPNQ